MTDIMFGRRVSLLYTVPYPYATHAQTAAYSVLPFVNALRQRDVRNYTQHPGITVQFSTVQHIYRQNSTVRAYHFPKYYFPHQYTRPKNGVPRTTPLQLQPPPQPPPPQQQQHKRARYPLDARCHQDEAGIRVGVPG